MYSIRSIYLFIYLFTAKAQYIIADIDDDVVNRTLSVRSPLDVVPCKIVLIFAITLTRDF